MDDDTGGDPSASSSVSTDTSDTTGPTATTATTGPTGTTIGEIWQAHRAYLVNVAARMLGDRADAEDIVQDAFGRLSAVPLDDIDDVRGWLTVVVRRLSLNRLRSAYRRREAAVGDDVDGAVAVATGALTTADPAERVTLDEQVQQALGVVLDRLSPAERTSFVLHDVFGFPFDAVAEIVGRTSAACRQLASRARRSVRVDVAPPAPGPDPGRTVRHRELAERFAAACAGGDLAELMAVLDPEVVGDATLLGGGWLSHAEGRTTVARRVMGLFGPDTGTTLVPVELEDHAGIVALDRDHFVAVMRLEEHEGHVAHIHAYVLRP